MGIYKRALIAVPLALASVVAVGASSAAASSGTGNCIGVFASNVNEFGRGLGGRDISTIARLASVDDNASSNCGNP